MTYDISKWNENKTNRENAEFLGISPENARYIAKKFGLKFRKGESSREEIFDISKWDESKTPHENADIQGISYSSIYKRINKYKLKCKKVDYYLTTARKKRGKDLVKRKKKGIVKEKFPEHKEGLISGDCADDFNWRFY